MTTTAETTTTEAETTTTETTTSETTTTVTETVTTTEPKTEVTLCGDANCDGKVDVSDAVLIMQTLSNPSKYQLTEQGKANADCSGDGDGVTNSDALAIQKFMLSLIDKLPETSK